MNKVTTGSLSSRVCHWSWPSIARRANRALITECAAKIAAAKSFGSVTTVSHAPATRDADWPFLPSM